MKISVEVLTEENIFKKIQFDTNNKILLDLQIELANILNISLNNQLWYLQGEELDYNFSDWINNYSYSVFIEKDYITLFIKNKNKIIKTPQISKNMKIKELKNILSIKDNIYYRNIKLLDHKTFNYYNISNNKQLNIQSINLDIN